MRSLKYTLIALAFVAGLNSCKEQETPEPTLTQPTPKDLIVFDSNIISIPAPSENWVVAWDSDGKLLDFKKYNLGEKLSLTTTETLADNKFTLGLFSYRVTQSNRTECFATFYTDLTPGVAHKRTYQSNSVTSTDKFKVTLTSPPPPSTNVQISSQLGGLGYSANDNAYTCDLDPRTDKYLVTYRVNDQQFYKRLSGIKANSIVTLGSTDFTSFEKTATFNLPSSYSNFSVVFLGSDADAPPIFSGYILDFYFSGPSMATQIKSGYFESIKKFSVYLSVTMSGKYVNYRKYGALPTTINWPDVNKYNSTSLEPYNFVSTVSEPFNYQLGTWQFNDGKTNRSWTIVSPKLAPKIGTVPAEILSSHPEFAAPTTLTYSAVSFVKTSQTYADYVTDEFTDSLHELETMSVEIVKN